jgi:hypothetical protein
MYTSSLEFLEDERDAWRPFEALDGLSDEDLTRPIEGAHGWSGRDLMAHLAGCQEIAIEIAKELAVGESSPTAVRVDADWEARGGDVVNEEMRVTWAELPLEEVRRRFRSAAGELRGYLTVVPETRWLKNPRNLESISECGLDHYPDHLEDLRAILAASGSKSST